MAGILMKSKNDNLRYDRVRTYFKLNKNHLF